MGERVTLYERDILYPTNEKNDPGIITVKVFSPTKSGYIPIILENKSHHLIKDYIEPIIGVVQTDIFNRVNINIKSEATIYIKSQENNIISYRKLLFKNDEIEFFYIDNFNEVFL